MDDRHPVVDGPSHDRRPAHHDLDGTPGYQSQYPDPRRAVGNPYPALALANYGPFPGIRQPDDEDDPSLIAQTENQSSTQGVGNPLEPDTDDYRAVAERFHLRHGDPGQSQVRNWHLQTGEQINYDIPDGSDHIDGDSPPPSDDGDWQDRVVQDRQDSDDADFDPDDAAIDTFIDDIDAVEETRPRGRGRGRPRQRGAGAGTTRRGGWRKLLKGTEHENVGRVSRRGNLDDDGNPRRGRPRGRGKARRAIDPGFHFKEHLRNASQAYLNGELEEGADYARLAIQANPEIFQAHSLLADILKAQGKDHDAMAVLRTGAYTLRQPELWMTVGNRMVVVANDTGPGGTPDPAFLRGAIECYAEALKLRTQLRPELELELRLAKFFLAREVGDDRTARQDARSILKQSPGEIEVCREYAQLCYRWDNRADLVLAKEAYEAAFAALGEEEDKKGEPAFAKHPEDAWNHVNVYLELVDMVAPPAEGVYALKRLARWMLGRKEEGFWDRFVEDDREFDNNVGRRGLVPEFQSGTASFDKFKYGEGLPVEIRNRLGLFRLKMGLEHFEEAQRHFQPLLTQVDQVDDYHDTFLQTATALRESGHVAEAVEFYNPLRMVPEVIDEQTWLLIGDCYQHLGKQDDAIECYEEAAEVEGKSYAVALQKLAKLYEAAGDMEKAKTLCGQLVRLGRKDLLSAEQLKEFPEVRKPRLGRRERTTRATQAEITRRMLRNSDAQGPVGAQGPRDATEFVPAGEDREGNDVDDAEDVETSQDDERAPTPKKTRRSKGKKRSFLATLSGEPEPEGDTEQEQERSQFPRPYKSRRYRLAQQRVLQMQDSGARVQVNFSVVRMHWPALLRGDDEAAVEQWMESAANLAVDFADMEVFFPHRDRNDHIRMMEEGVFMRVPGTASHTDFAPPPDFHSTPFTEWHRVFVELALLYARRAEQERCYHILQNILFSANVFYLVPDLDQANYGAAIACALTFNDSQYLIDLGRKLIAKSDARSPAAFQLFAALNRLTHSSGWFNAGPSQKFMLRMVKQIDFVTMPAAARDRFDWSVHKPSLLQRLARYTNPPLPPPSSSSSTSSPPPPTFPPTLDPGLLLMYGHMVAVANHSHAALPYYFRALALAPDSPSVLLSIATMWVQNAMKRQTDNRHFGVAQGLAYLYRYHELRTGPAEAGGGGGGGDAAAAAAYPLARKQEAEFNVARMWQQLGLAHLAVPGYERVLGLSAGVREEWEARWKTGEDGGEWKGEEGDEPEDFAAEAAFALQGLYALAGDDEMARRVGEEWLVL